MDVSKDYIMSDQGLSLLQEFFFSAVEAIFIVDDKGLILLSNKKAQTLFGYSSKELKGQPIEILIPNKYRKKHVELRNRYYEKPVSRPMGTGIDLEGLKKDGSTFPVEASLSHVKHNNKTLIVAFVMDISKRKEQEAIIHKNQEELKSYASQLEQKVKERTKELEHLNLGLKSQIRERKLAEKALQDTLKDVKKAEKDILKSLEAEKELNMMKSRFISMASHEFRTPLTTIMSSVDLISRYTDAEQQEKRNKHIGRIRNSVQNMINILNDFLSLEKLDSGVTKINTTSFSFESLMEEIYETVDLLLKKNQQFIKEVPELGMIKSDPHIIKNVLLNLLSNAIKYSNEGKNIWLSVIDHEKALEINVRDEGIGIPESDQKNMFDRFHRAANATNIQGTGLGLNISRRYMDLLQGTIDFTSEEGKGSNFIIKFPIQKIT